MKKNILIFNLLLFILTLPMFAQHREERHEVTVYRNMDRDMDKNTIPYIRMIRKMAEKLNISEEQKKQMRTYMVVFKSQSTFYKAAYSSGEMSRNEMQEKISALRDKLKNDVQNLMTSSQKQQLEKLKKERQEQQWINKELYLKTFYNEVINAMELDRKRSNSLQKIFENYLSEMKKRHDEHNENGMMMKNDKKPDKELFKNLMADVQKELPKNEFHLWRQYWMAMFKQQHGEHHWKEHHGNYEYHYREGDRKVKKRKKMNKKRF